MLLLAGAEAVLVISPVEAGPDSGAADDGAPELPVIAFDVAGAALGTDAIDLADQPAADRLGTVGEPAP